MQKVFSDAIKTRGSLLRVVLRIILFLRHLIIEKGFKFML